MEIFTPCLKHIFLNVWLCIVHCAESARNIIFSRYSQLLDRKYIHTCKSYHLVPSWSSQAMLMKFIQQEYFSGVRISCCFQMKTDKIKCFPEESVGNCSARSFARCIWNVPPECCNICLEHWGVRLANVSQMTEANESEGWKMWDPFPAWLCVGKDGTMLIVLIKQAFLSLLLPIWSNIGTKSNWRGQKRDALRRTEWNEGRLFLLLCLQKFRQMLWRKTSSV